MGHLEGPLEGADGQQRQVLLLFCVPHQVHIHQLLELRRTIASKQQSIEAAVRGSKATLGGGGPAVF